MDLPLPQIEAIRESNKGPAGAWAEPKGSPIPDYDEEPLEYELPNKPFKHLLKFMKPIGSRRGPGDASRPLKATQVTNFEIHIKEDPPEVYEPESYKIGNITFYKCKPTYVQERIDEKKCLRKHGTQL